jgi:hypothetical protein
LFLKITIQSQSVMRDRKTANVMKLLIGHRSLLQALPHVEAGAVEPDGGEVSVRKAVLAGPGMAAGLAEQVRSWLMVFPAVGQRVRARTTFDLVDSNEMAR